eukprot:scaffold82055_cov61-Phaeocystis_antarctica.AAC.1
MNPNQVLAALGARLLAFCKVQLWPTACSDIGAAPPFVQAYVQRYMPGETLTLTLTLSLSLTGLRAEAYVQRYMPLGETLTLTLTLTLSLTLTGLRAEVRAAGRDPNPNSNPNPNPKPNRPTCRGTCRWARP